MNCFICGHGMNGVQMQNDSAGQEWVMTCPKCGYKISLVANPEPGRLSAVYIPAGTDGKSTAYYRFDANGGTSL